MKLITAALFVWCSLFVAAQTRVCVPSTTEYAPDVKSAMELGPGWKVSWTDKHINRLGDGAAVVLIRMGAPKSLETPKQVDSALHVITLAFQCPRCIADEENRSASVTMMLLDALSAQSKGRAMKKKIADVRKYVAEYVSANQPTNQLR